MKENELKVLIRKKKLYQTKLKLFREIFKDYNQALENLSRQWDDPRFERNQLKNERHRTYIELTKFVEKLIKAATILQ